MKKFLSMLLTLAIVFSFAACTLNNETTGTSDVPVPSSSENTVTSNENHVNSDSTSEDTTTSSTDSKTPSPSTSSKAPTSSAISSIPNPNNADSTSEEAPVETKGIAKIVDESDESNRFFLTALEQFYRDDSYTYYYSCNKSPYVKVYYDDGTNQTVKEALKEGKIKISDLDKWEIQYYKESKTGSWS